MPSAKEKLTKSQRYEAERLFERGHTIWPTGVYNIPRHRPLGRLVDLGIAQIDYGPTGSWLNCLCYLPVWSDPIC